MVIDSALVRYFYFQQLLARDHLSEKFLSEALLIKDDTEIVQSSSNIIIEHVEEELNEKVSAIQIEPKPTEAIVISPPAESSGDEVSYSYSPSTSKGILKAFRKNRHFGRSISESGLDEVWASSEEIFDDASVDSVIPEEEEISTSLKKTVRFNDDVSRQLFRSNSSILGQRKKEKLEN